MADRLKYYDPVLEKTIDDQQQEGNEDGSNATPQMEEQKWLQSLRLLAQQYKLDYASPAAATATNYEASQTQQDPHYNYQQQQIDQQFMEINKQFSELNLQYQTNSEPQQPPVFYNPTEIQQPPVMTTADSQQPQQPVPLDPYQSQPQSLQPEQPLTQANDMQQTQHADDARTQDPYQPSQLSYMQTDNMQQLQQQDYQQNYYDPSQQQQHQQQQQPQQHYVDGSLDGQTAASNSYDYWSQQQQQPLQQIPAYGEEVSL